MARSITTNGTTLYLTADVEDRYTRFDFNTGPGAGSAYSTASYNGAGLRVFHHDVWGNNHSLQYNGRAPGASLLSDNTNVYTPGISQRNLATGQSRFFITDGQGSLRGTNDSRQTSTKQPSSRGRLFCLGR